MRNSFLVKGYSSAIPIESFHGGGHSVARVELEESLGTDIGSVITTCLGDTIRPFEWPIFILSLISQEGNGFFNSCYSFFGYPRLFARPLKNKAIKLFLHGNEIFDKHSWIFSHLVMELEYLPVHLTNGCDLVFILNYLRILTTKRWLILDRSNPCFTISIIRNEIFPFFVNPPLIVFLLQTFLKGPSFRLLWDSEVSRHVDDVVYFQHFVESLLK